MSHARLVADDGRDIRLDVHRWRAAPDCHEAALLATLRDPVLDVGCGPGRVVEALALAGRPALGIDPAPTAWREAGQRGAAVLCRSVFDPLPAEGRWGTALLLDGNIGIGGDPRALLERLGQLVRVDGEVVAELQAAGDVTWMTARVEVAGSIGPPFPWAAVGVDGWARAATAAGLADATVTREGTRWFGRATRR